MSHSTSLDVVGAYQVFTLISSDPAATNLAQSTQINVTTNTATVSPNGTTLSYIPYLNSEFSIRLATPIVLSQPSKFQACIVSASFQPPRSVILDSTIGWQGPLFVYSNLMSPSTIGSSQFGLLGIIQPPAGGSSDVTNPYPQLFTQGTIPQWYPVSVSNIQEISITFADDFGNLIPANDTDITIQTPNSPPSSWTAATFPIYSYQTTIIIALRRIAEDD